MGGMYGNEYRQNILSGVRLDFANINILSENLIKNTPARQFSFSRVILCHTVI
jgi:hypothetical protein